MFFVFGSPRSGTTLLAQTLNAHSRLAVPHESDFIVPLAFLLERVVDPEIGRDLVSRLIPSTKLYRAGWSLAEHLSPDEIERVVRGCEYSLPAILNALYAETARKAGKTSAGDKSPDDLQSVHRLDVNGAFSNPCRIIHIVRDIRDVMESLLRQGWAAGLDSYFPRMWSENNLYLRRMGESMPDRYAFVRYEDMAREPERVFRGICAVLGVEYEEEMLLPEKRRPPLLELPYHRKLRFPINTESIGLHRGRLNEDLLRGCERQAGEAMEEFDYIGSGVAGRTSTRPEEDAPRKAAARRGIRLGLLMADSTPPEERYNEQSPAAFGHFRSYLRGKMPECEVVYRYTVEDLLAEKVDIVGISSSTEEYESAKEMARDCREAGVPVLVGGVHITAIPENLSPHMDVAVLGEGEETLHELLRLFALRGRRFPEEDLRRVRGIAFRSGASLVRTPPRPLIANLDDLPIPEREFMWIGRPSERAFLSTTRGCPYRCVFCASSSFWGSMRHFSAERVADEVETLHRDLGLGELHFHDDLFITPRRRLEKIASLLEERGLAGAIRFSGTVRANLVDDRLCETLNRMGFWAVMFGAESFSKKVLDYLKCGTVSPEENQRALDTLHRNGLTAFVQMIHASPVETREDLRTTFEALERNFADGRLKRWQEGVLTPYPGTPVWEEAKRAGLVSETMNWNRIRDREIYMGGIPEREFRAMLEEHRDRCILLRPEQEDLWREWGLTKERVLDTALRERPERILSALDFDTDGQNLQIGDGWYDREGSESGGGFRWMGRESTTWLRGGANLGRLEIAGYAFPDRHPDGKLRIDVSVNGETIGETFVEESGFTVAFELPENLRGERLLRVRLRLDHSFHSPPDLRELGVSVSRVGLVPDPVAAATSPALRPA
ncbi:MAG: sulfotransferase [Candidatus Eisenbacteria bacterium]|nr:sulfotransferase [Candidatus Eisenbacteria bacterium]